MGRLSGSIIAIATNVRPEMYIIENPITDAYNPNQVSATIVPIIVNNSKQLLNE